MRVSIAGGESSQPAVARGVQAVVAGGAGIRREYESICITQNRWCKNAKATAPN